MMRCVVSAKLDLHAQPFHVGAHDAISFDGVMHL